MTFLSILGSVILTGSLTMLLLMLTEKQNLKSIINYQTIAIILNLGQNITKCRYIAPSLY